MVQVLRCKFNTRNLNPSNICMYTLTGMRKIMFQDHILNINHKFGTFLRCVPIIITFYCLLETNERLHIRSLEIFFTMTWIFIQWHTNCVIHYSIFRIIHYIFAIHTFSYIHLHVELDTWYIKNGEKFLNWTTRIYTTWYLNKIWIINKL